MELVELAEKVVIGQSVRTKNMDEMSGAGRIPQLWQIFQSELFGKRLPVGEPMGVYHNYEFDHNGMYTLLAGVESKGGGDDLEQVVIPAGKYLKFVAEGPVPLSVVTTWQKNWTYFANEGVEYTRAYTADFELYKSTTKAEIYISVR